MQILLQHVQQLHSLGTAATEAISNSFEQLVLPKGSCVLKEGMVCRQLYFVESGALRGFYNLDGKEITHWFGFEHDFVTSFHSFITGKPAVENIQLMEGAVLWSIQKEQLTDLCTRFHEIERLVRLVNEQYYIRLEERFVNAQFKTAGERYEQLLTQAPHLLERMPLGCIATYLGISQETLSRIRSQL